MSTSESPFRHRRDDARLLRSTARLTVGAAPKIRHVHGIIILCSLLAVASVLVLLTTSCVKIPCPGGNPDPNWCVNRGGGGGESGG